jgi:hypothetical protein
MLAVLSLAALYGGWRVARSARSALAALRRLPRCNDDMVFF